MYSTSYSTIVDGELGTYGKKKKTRIIQKNLQRY